MADDPLEQVRAACRALPEVTERTSHGEPTWFAGAHKSAKSFVMYCDHHHGARLAFWCAAPPGGQRELIAADPDRFYLPPYVGTRGWVGVYLDVPVDWAEVGELVTDAYRLVAPKRLLAELDQDG